MSPLKRGAFFIRAYRFERGFVHAHFLEGFVGAVFGFSDAGANVVFESLPSVSASVACNRRSRSFSDWAATSSSLASSSRSPLLAAASFSAVASCRSVAICSWSCSATPADLASASFRPWISPVSVCVCASWPCSSFTCCLDSQATARCHDLNELVHPVSAPTFPAACASPFGSRGVGIHAVVDLVHAALLQTPGSAPMPRAREHAFPLGSGSVYPGH